MKKTLTVIIPVYNELQGSYLWIIQAFINAKIDVIVIDDGSDLPIKGLPCRVIRREKNKGYGSAIKLGLRYAQGSYIGIIDADSQYDPIDLIDLWQSMDDEDMLIGRRITHQGNWRRLFGRLFIKSIASLCCLRWIPDLNSGVRIFKKNIVKSYRSILCDTFSFTTSMTLCLILDRYEVKWLPIGFYPRKGQPSTVKMIRHGLITFYQIMYITIGLRTRRLRQWLRKG